MNAQQEVTTATLTPCVTTPRDRTTAHVKRVLLVMALNVQVRSSLNFLFYLCHFGVCLFVSLGQTMCVCIYQFRCSYIYVHIYVYVYLDYTSKVFPTFYFSLVLTLITKVYTVHIIMIMMIMMITS